MFFYNEYLIVDMGGAKKNDLPIKKYITRDPMYYLFNLYIIILLYKLY